MIRHKSTPPAAVTVALIFITAPINVETNDGPFAGDVFFLLSDFRGFVAMSVPV
jgi:hypothetical protein